MKAHTRALSVLTLLLLLLWTPLSNLAQAEARPVRHDHASLVSRTANGSASRVVDDLQADKRNVQKLCRHADVLKTLISAAMTIQETCWHGFSHENVDKEIHKALIGVVAKAPELNGIRYVIIIKASVYTENVKVPKKTNIMFVGDGRTRTIITGNGVWSMEAQLSTLPQLVTVVHERFLARDITFNSFGNRFMNGSLPGELTKVFKLNSQNSSKLHEVKAAVQNSSQHTCNGFCYGLVEIVGKKNQ
ncbi:hypothetical protein F3Y22_tig00109923pilonHSYRG00024 [Hibiscus syriacus]|uniref:Pectinesterase catalytic domain-containing protein n=1 Tax=Hibiscus syriacus TaxID=106335 RepID=A0A6A3BY69_HIBSY|nr:hypothetical protein F3Y22_tig00109923pilonHSYRG00024 [Hibiscus syriacus]